MVFDSITPAGVTNMYAYDSLRRRDFEMGRDDVLLQYGYKYGSNRIIHVQNDAHPLYDYNYDSSGRLNYIRRYTTVSFPEEYTYYAYDTADRKTHQWGNAEVPAKWVYDSYGRLAENHHYKNSASGWDTILTGGSAGTTPSKPTEFDSVGSSRVLYDYHDTMGMLYKKLYYDGSAPTETFYDEYSYTKLNQVATVKDKRTNSTATYTYFSNPKNMDLQKIDYADGTTTESFTYTRAGRMNTVADAAGTRTFAYDSTKKVKLQYETFDSAKFGGKQFEYTWETSGVPGRSTGVKFGTSGTKNYRSTYTFESTGGRINGVNTNWTTSNNDYDNFSYSYLSNSNLLEITAMESKRLSIVTVSTNLIENNWESWRNVKDGKINWWNSSKQAEYGILHTWQQQQSRYWLNAGALRSAYNKSSVDINPISYDTRGQVTSYTSTA